MTDGWSSNPSGQHEAGKAAESSVRLEQHFYALVPTQYSGEDDRPIRIRGRLVHQKVVGNKIRDDHIGTPSR
jgi:hypothetical protein